MYVNKCTKCGAEFETKNPKRVICPDCLYPDKKMMLSSELEQEDVIEKPQEVDQGNNQHEEPQKQKFYSSYSYETPQQQHPPRQNNYPRRDNYSDRGNYQRRDNYGDNRGGYQRPQQGGYQRPRQDGYQRPQQGGYQRRDNYGDNRGGYQRPQQGGYQRPQQGGYNRPQGGYQRPQQGGYQRPQGGAPRFGGNRPRPPINKNKPLLVNKEQLEQIELLYKAMLPLPNPDAHEVIGAKIELEPRKVFFGINLIRQKLMLPKLPFPKRKLAISPDQMFAIQNLYEPLLPLPPIGCHKIIAAQLKMDEWRVHVGIGLIRAKLGLSRWNQERADAPEEFKKAAKEKVSKAKKTKEEKPEKKAKEPKAKKETKAKKESKK